MKTTRFNFPAAGILAVLFFQSLELFARAAEPFILGTDVSWVQQQEDEGRKFSVSGTNVEFFATLRGHGFNWVRLRLFNSPANEHGYSKKGYCDLPHTVAFAKRAKAAGLNLLLDFHYSDTWADPKNQHRPLAWRDLDDNALPKAVGVYTKESLSAFKAANALPDMVQIGNEISNGMLWKAGESNLTNWVLFSDVLKAGIAATHAVDPQIKTMLHLAMGGSNGGSRWFLDNVTKRGVTFDIIGQSYYPQWHGTLENLRANLTDLTARYKMPVIVVEYSEPTIREVNDIVHELPNGQGLGTFIWEPFNWPHSDDPPLVTRSGAAKPALDLFTQMSRDYAKP